MIANIKTSWSHLYNSIWSSSVPKSVKGSSDVKVLRPIFLSESHVWSRWSRCQCFSASLRSRRDWSQSSWWSKYVFLFFYLCEVLYSASRQTAGLRESSDTVCFTSLPTAHCCCTKSLHANNSNVIHIFAICLLFKTWNILCPNKNIKDSSFVSSILR